MSISLRKLNRQYFSNNQMVKIPEIQRTHANRQRNILFKKKAGEETEEKQRIDQLWIKTG